MTSPIFLIFNPTPDPTLNSNLDPTLTQLLVNRDESIEDKSIEMDDTCYRCPGSLHHLFFHRKLGGHSLNNDC